MDCCQNITNLYNNYNKDLSIPYYYKGINEKNYIKVNKRKQISDDNKIIHSVYKNNSSSKMGQHYNPKTLDKIIEVESEIRESSMNSRILTREKASPLKTIKIFENFLKNKKNKRGFGKSLSMKRNRSQPKYKMILSDEIFNKKLNE